MTGKVGRPRKSPADPWSIVEHGTLETGQEVTVWQNTATEERRVVPHGLHPAQQPLAEDDPPVEEVFEDTAENRIQAMMEQARDTGSILRLYRVERNNKLSWIEDFSPSEWEEGGERMVRESYGPGDYEVRLWQKGVRAPLRGKLQMHIAGPRVTAPPAPTTDPNLAQILASIAENQRTMLQAITERPPQPDPTVEMTKMLNLMVTMRQAMGVDQQQPRSQIGEIVAAIRELREASEEIAPPKEAEGLMGQLPRVLDLVQSGMQAQAQQPPQPQSMLPIPPIALPESIAQAPVPSPSPQPGLQLVPDLKPTPTESPKEAAVFNPLSILQLRAYLKTLLKMAEKDEPVAKAATFVYDKAPDEILDIMALDSWQELLEEVAPEAKQHRDYLQRVRDAAMAMFDEDDAQADAAD